MKNVHYTISERCPLFPQTVVISNIGLAGEKHLSVGLGDICSNLVLIMSRIKLSNASLLNCLEN